MTEVNEKKEAVLSPFTPPVNPVSPENMEKIKELLGVECVFLMVQNKAHTKENCVDKPCPGHGIFIISDGFSEQFSKGIIDCINKAGNMGQAKPE